MTKFVPLGNIFILSAMQLSYMLCVICVYAKQTPEHEKVARILWSGKIMIIF